MKLRYFFLRETEAARLYRNAAGREFWIPRSVINRTLKHPPKELAIPPIHEMEIEDWWLEKNELP